MPHKFELKFTNPNAVFLANQVVTGETFLKLFIKFKIVIEAFFKKKSRIQESLS